MHRFRGTDVGLGLLAIAVNVGLVVGVVVMTTGRGDERPPAAVGTASPTASPSPSSPSPTPTPSASKPEDLFARDTPITLTVLGDQTGDGEGEWVWVLSDLLGRDRQVTLHQLDPEDPTVYAQEKEFGTSGPEVAVYNGSRADAVADYGARRLAFLSPKNPDLVILNYGRNDSAKKVGARLEKTAKAVRSTWKGALLAVTLQPPTAGDDSKQVRDEVLEWAKDRDVTVLDVAKRFRDTGEADSYVSGRDPSAMSSRGDVLWGRTAYRLLVGADPPEVVTPTPTSTGGTPTQPAPAPGPAGSTAPGGRVPDTTAPEPTAPAPSTTPPRIRETPSPPPPTEPEPPPPTEPEPTPTPADPLGSP